MEAEGEQWFKLVQRQQDGVAGGTRLFLYRRQNMFPFVPGTRRLVEAGFFQQVAAIEQASAQARMRFIFSTRSIAGTVFSSSGIAVGA